MAAILYAINKSKTKCISFIMISLDGNYGDFHAR